MPRKTNNRPFSTKIPKSFFDHPIYKELTDVIICMNQKKIIPRRWDELEIDFNNSSIRYCSLCDEKVYKVSNLHNYNKVKEKNVCIAVPLNSVLFQEIYEEYREQVDIFIFVQISRRLMQEVGYIEINDIQVCDEEKVVAFILS